MTNRLYYNDSYLAEFSATVVSCEPRDQRFDVVLDQTAFYPTSGGQPFDQGTLGDALVLDVIDQDDGTIAHVVDRSVVPGATVLGKIDWHRRFDHMQQHTGQHVLSAAFERLLAVRTESFHLGTASATIDLGREVTRQQMAVVAEESNRIVWEDRPVVVRFASAEEARALPLRKESLRTGPLRLVEVEDFDLSACGGVGKAIGRRLDGAKPFSASPACWPPQTAPTIPVLAGGDAGRWPAGGRHHAEHPHRGLRAPAPARRRGAANP